MSLKENKCLLLPGPVYIPHRVLQAMGKQMMNRRGEEFQAILTEVTENLKDVYGTENDVILFPGSGTGGLETAIVNALSPGDTVLALTCGVFSSRFAEIAETMGMNVKRLTFPLESGVDPDEVENFLKKDKEIKAVLVTHNETSTGVTNDIEALGVITSKYDVLLFVDAVSSLGGIPVNADKWKLDIVISASQKALFAAPGLAFVNVSEKAWEWIDRSTSPRYFWDLRRAQKFYLEKRITPYTSAMTTLYGLQEALRIVKEEGLEDVLKRHEVNAKALRAGLSAMGLQLYVEDERRASRTVTTVRVPKGVQSAALRKTMSKKYHVLVAGGLGEIKDTTFRIGHLGYIGRGEILNGISALELALCDNDYPVTIGAGVSAAQKVYAENL